MDKIVSEIGVFACEFLQKIGADSVAVHMKCGVYQLIKLSNPTLATPFAVEAGWITLGAIGGVVFFSWFFFGRR